MQCESRIDELTDELRWCEGVFRDPATDPAAREGWNEYVAPLIAECEDERPGRG